MNHSSAARTSALVALTAILPEGRAAFAALRAGRPLASDERAAAVRLIQALLDVSGAVGPLGREAHPYAWSAREGLVLALEKLLPLELKDAPRFAAWIDGTLDLVVHGLGSPAAVAPLIGEVLDVNAQREIDPVLAGSHAVDLVLARPADRESAGSLWVAGGRAWMEHAVDAAVAAFSQLPDEPASPGMEAVMRLHVAAFHRLRDSLFGDRLAATVMVQFRPAVLQHGLAVPAEERAALIRTLLALVAASGGVSPDPAFLEIDETDGLTTIEAVLGDTRFAFCARSVDLTRPANSIPAVEATWLRG